VTSSAERALPPIEYRDRHRRVWQVSEVARLKVVWASIDGPNLCLVIRFERAGEERFARWIGARTGACGVPYTDGSPRRSGPTRPPTTRRISER
jgi:hypothetical protein